MSGITNGPGLASHPAVGAGFPVPAIGQVWKETIEAARTLGITPRQIGYKARKCGIGG